MLMKHFARAIERHDPCRSPPQGGTIPQPSPKPQPAVTSGVHHGFSFLAARSIVSPPLFHPASAELASVGRRLTGYITRREPQPLVSARPPP
jgi:hypothetical protein